jgi:hypothetical protein
MLRLILLALAALAPSFLSTGCLGTLHHSRDAEEISGAAADVLPTPLRETRPHWFLRQEAGWLGAHRTRFGGEGDDEGFTIVRVALFTDAAAASAALARITPQYMHALWHSRMALLPQPVSFPVAISGDEVSVAEYPLRLSPGEERTEELIVQVVSLRAGRAVLVVESIGVPREGLAPVVDRLVRAAHRAGPGAR